MFRILILCISLALPLLSVELVDEQFNSNINSWSKSNSSKVYHSNSYGGSMFIDRNDRSWKTYSFGSQYANQDLDVEVEWCATEQWDNRNDYLRIKINNLES